jgi:molybdate transport system substrate-binding protein
MPEPLRVMSTLGMQGVLQEVLPAAELAAVQFDPTAALLARLRRGEAADIAILTGEGIEELTAAGVLAADGRVDLSRSHVGMAVRPGTPKPDISTPEACIATLRAARSLAYSRAGASGIFFAGLLERLGIAEEINAKAVVIPAGFTAERLMRGEVDLAIQQVSELMAVPGVEILGKLPAALNTEVVFAGAPFSASPRSEAGAAWLRRLAAACTPALLRGKGLEPA